MLSLEVCPEERSPISTRVVLKVKKKANGEFDKFKARAVVRGFMAKIGVDYLARKNRRPPTPLQPRGVVLDSVQIRHKLGTTGFREILLRLISV